MSDEGRVLEILKREEKSAVGRREWGVVYLLQQLQSHPLIEGQSSTTTPLNSGKPLRFSREDFGKNGIFRRDGDTLLKMGFSKRRPCGYYTHRVTLPKARQVAVVVEQMHGPFVNDDIHNQMDLTVGEVQTALSWMRENRIISTKPSSLISENIQGDINKAWDKTEVEDGGQDLRAAQINGLKPAAVPA